MSYRDMPALGAFCYGDSIIINELRARLAEAERERDELRARVATLEAALRGAVALMRNLYTVGDAFYGQRYALHPDSPRPQAVLDRAEAALSAQSAPKGDAP